MNKVITFSLWGEDPKYCEGAIQNAILAKEIYPDWECLFYIDGKTTPPEYYFHLTAMDNVIAREMPSNMEGWKGMFARFLPASEPDVDVFISRDCDSRLSRREAYAVNEWLDSSYLIHAIRDHPFHTAPILGGLWGAKKDGIPEMTQLIDEWNMEDRWQTDQELLRDKVWPAHWHKVLVHDDWNRFPQAKNLPFSDPREPGEFVGAIIGPNGERLHPEHHAML